MSISHTCENGRVVLISKADEIGEDITATGLIPCVLMITAWTMQIVSVTTWRPLIEVLLKKGCSHIVCAGSYAEQLHDLIDDIVEDSSDLFDDRPYDVVLTTYHDDDSAQDVAEFFTNATDVWEKENGGLVAVLGEGDDDIKAHLLKL